MIDQLKLCFLYNTPTQPFFHQCGAGWCVEGQDDDYERLCRLNYTGYRSGLGVFVGLIGVGKITQSQWQHMGGGQLSSILKRVIISDVYHKNDWLGLVHHHCADHRSSVNENIKDLYNV